LHAGRVLISFSFTGFSAFFHDHRDVTGLTGQYCNFPNGTNHLNVVARGDDDVKKRDVNAQRPQDRVLRNVFPWNIFYNIAVGD
jgi:hypothetical protein